MLASVTFTMASLSCRIDGGQAEYVRVPFADQGLNKIPDKVTASKSPAAIFIGTVIHITFLAEKTFSTKSFYIYRHPVSWLHLLILVVIWQWRIR